VSRAGAFTPLERAVLERLLDGHHPVLRVLRRQLEVATVLRRELTGVGFFTHVGVPAEGCTPAPITRARVIFGDVAAEIEGLERGAGFLLFVEAGWLAMLEGYCYDERWPGIDAAFALRYETFGAPAGRADPPGRRLGALVMPGDR
jgi:hypothetical protein